MRDIFRMTLVAIIVYLAIAKLNVPKFVGVVHGVGGSWVDALKTVQGR
jgi:hypothetical protein